jgi:hypothetical protein
MYAPFSTWRSLFIEAMSPRSAQLLCEEYEPSPSLTRVLKYPETGFYARELLIPYGDFWKADSVDDCAFVQGTLAGFDRFLANTPRLETIRCIGPGNEVDFIYDSKCRVKRFKLPVAFFASISSLASLRYLYLGGIDDLDVISREFPSLNQIRILRYSPTAGCTMLGELLSFSGMWDIHTLYVTGDGLHRLDVLDAADMAVGDMEVRRHFFLP